MRVTHVYKPSPHPPNVSILPTFYRPLILLLAFCVAFGTKENRAYRMSFLFCLFVCCVRRTVLDPNGDLQTSTGFLWQRQWFFLLLKYTLFFLSRVLVFSQAVVLTHLFIAACTIVIFGGGVDDVSGHNAADESRIIKSTSIISIWWLHSMISYLQYPMRYAATHNICSHVLIAELIFLGYICLTYYVHAVMVWCGISEEIHTHSSFRAILLWNQVCLTLFFFHFCHHYPLPEPATQSIQFPLLLNMSDFPNAWKDSK